MQHQRFLARSHAQLEAEILEAAEDRLAERGCVLFNGQEVAGQVGIAKGTIYLHVGNRFSLISAVLDRTAARSLHTLAAALGSPGAPGAIGGIARWARATADTSNHHAAVTGRRQLPYPCCLFQAICPFAEQDPMLSSIASLLDAARDAGELDDDWWESAMIARWIRAVIGDLLARCHTLNAEQIDSELTTAERFLRAALASG
jgi:AcrR family transcriptional regulator